jgi:hypothetical protein
MLATQPGLLYARVGSRAPEIALDGKASPAQGAHA